MKIVEVNIEENKKVGLKAIKMSRLNNIVLIAGKNGSGKSRFLNLLKITLTQKLNISTIKTYEQNVKDYENIINSAKSRIEILKRSDDKNKEKLLETEIDKINKYEVQRKHRLDNLNCNKIITDDLYDNYSYIDFVPTNLTLQDCNTLTKAQISQYVKHLDNSVGISGTHQSAFSKIQYIQDKWFEATHQNSTIDKEKKTKIINDYDNLREYIDIFLETKLDRDENGDATLFGLRLGMSNLSNGQKVLLQLCIAIYSQQNKLNDLIIFLDEPENHLHPHALIEFIDKLTSIVTNGQIWITTHSINLLSHVDPSNIWYIEDGLISYSGTLPNKVLNGLIGSEDEISKLKNFLSLPALMANSKFAFECLFNPEVVSTGVEDPQTNQIIDAINVLKRNDEKIKVLDFGAGKGRLLATIIDFNNENDINISDWLDYYAFDLPSDDEQICKKVIENVYYESESRYFTNENSFLESIDLNSFDLIIMCNVFHEINPNEWLNLFNEHKLILSSLKDEGILLIVEDQLLAIGEKAYQNGFLVFDKFQFKKLFNISDYKYLDARGDGRLKAHFIPVNMLSNISSESRKSAIESLNVHAKDEIKRLRESNPSYKNGKLHGFWVQQLANSQLVLSELSN